MNNLTKIQRFLNSINIENQEDFDLDFDYVSRNKNDYNLLDMVIIKDEPWEYKYLDQFINALSLINYRYTLSFKYKRIPTVDDVISLFESWKYSKIFFSTKLTYQQNNQTLLFVCENDDEKLKYEQTINEFKELLSFINYNINVDLVVSKNGETIEEEIVEDEDDDSSLDIEEFEKKFIEIEEEQKRLSEQEERDRLAWVKGNYQVIDDLSSINANTGNVDISGEIFGVEDARKTKKGKTFRLFSIWSNNHAISLRVFESGKTLPKESIDALKNGKFIRVRGATTMDSFSKEIKIMVHYMEFLPNPPLREDHSELKRVELHLHTNMSNMDGIGTMDKYAALAKNMGHKAIAITDHGVCQGFPSAQAAGKSSGLKILYGSELYVVDDELPFGLNPSKREILNAKYVCFDLETTGLSARYDRITEFGAVKIEKGLEISSVDYLINPTIPIPLKIQNKTHITDSMVKNKPTIEQTIDQILDFFEDAIIVSHNINFDIGFLNEALKRMGREPIKNPCIDTLSLSRYMFPESNRHNLGTLSRNLGLTTYDEDEAHRADFDARILSEVWMEMLPRLTQNHLNMTHEEVSNIKASETLIKHMRPSHATVLVKNKEGLKALYELISESHITYLADVPKTPKRELQRLRKDLIIGSGCVNGEVFDTAQTRSKEVLKEKMKFYDFIEVQPPENYSFLVEQNKVESMDNIIQYIKDIIEVADELNIPVCATGDCHYVNPEEKVFRDVYVCAPAVGGKLHPLFSRDRGSLAPNQHYRSTEEMLEAFSFLGEEKAKEIVITNTNMIADQIENIQPIGTTLNKPEIENAPETLVATCFAKAKELYGDPLPEFLEERLKLELDGICNNGYAVTYSIAREIIRRANEDGYMVGSRGSVGSSLAATMFNITEVNPLPPHYRCPHCKHLEWVDPIVNKSGFDLEDKNCPICGTKMIADGQNIPFATFLGFNAEKIPDIDLNFPSDYQQKAHDSTKDIFGEHNVFRAGTIGTVEEKTAFGYVKGYYEKKFHLDSKKGEDIFTRVSRNDVAYLASKCVGVKRTTGQHAGGVMILPKGRSIYEFTPVQYPADDKESSWLTTHYEYRAIHDSLLKLDLLGHVDPLALRLMSELTGIDVHDIPMNDRDVISIFTSIRALKMKSNVLDAKTGSLAIPEFGTTTAIQTLVETQPHSFSDLVIISGLSHGTGVWAGNAEKLIVSGEKTLREVIGCRDDIMISLSSWGIDKSDAFKIMEFVRKGGPTKKPGEWPKWKQIMIDHNIEQWYIDSCEKIEYMFPKAHAVAYVTQAVRVAYFKVYYPLEFYSVWFSVRAKAYEIRTMLKGLEAITNRYKELQAKSASKKEKLSPKENDIMAMLKIAIEMHERGFVFKNIDLYKSDATRFIVDHENKALLLQFTTMDGLGESAAVSVVEARNEKPFTSQEDLLKRTKLSQTIVKELNDLDCLDGLGESDQMSLFEFSF